METKKKPIGLTIKDMMVKKKMTVKAVAQEKGVHRQTIYDVFKRESMRLSEIEDWARRLDVSVVDLIGPEYEEKTTDVVQLPDSYLSDFVKSLQQRIDEQANTIRDQAETIRLLLGKSKGVFGSQVLPFFFEALEQNSDTPSTSTGLVHG